MASGTSKLQTSCQGIVWVISLVSGDAPVVGVEPKQQGRSWSGRRDLNPGPLAPQAKNINRLQTAPAENPRLVRRDLDAKWTPNGRQTARFSALDSSLTPLRRIDNSSVSGSLTLPASNRRGSAGHLGLAPEARSLPWLASLLASHWPEQASAECEASTHSVVPP